MAKQLSIPPKKLRESEFNRYFSAIKKRYNDEAPFGPQRSLYYLMQRLTHLQQRLTNQGWIYEKALEEVNRKIRESSHVARMLRSEISEIEERISTEGLDDAEFVSHDDYETCIQAIEDLEQEISNLDLDTLTTLRKTLSSEYRNLLINKENLENKLAGLSLTSYDSPAELSAQLKQQAFPNIGTPHTTSTSNTSKAFLYGKAFCIGVAAYAIVGPLCAKAKGLPASTAFLPVSSSVGAGIQDGIADFWNEVLSMAYDQASGDIDAVISEFATGSRTISEDMINQFIQNFESKGSWSEEKIQSLKEHLQVLSQCPGTVLSELITIGLEQEQQAPESLKRAWQDNALISDMARIRSVALGVTLGTVGGKIGTLSGGPVGSVIGGAIGTGLGSVADAFCQDFFQNNERLNQLMLSIDPVIAVANHRPVRVTLRTLEMASIGALLAGPVGAGVGGGVGLAWGANEVTINHQGKRLKINLEKLRIHIENMKAPDEVTSMHLRLQSEIDKVLDLIEFREDPLHQIDIDKLRQLNTFVTQAVEVTQNTLELLDLALQNNHKLLESIKSSYEDAIEKKYPKQQRQSILISQETVELLIEKQKQQYNQLQAKLKGDLSLKEYYETSILPSLIRDIESLPEKLVTQILTENQAIPHPLEENLEFTDVLAQVVQSYKRQQNKTWDPLTTPEPNEGIYLSQNAPSHQKVEPYLNITDYQSTHSPMKVNSHRRNRHGE